MNATPMLPWSTRAVLTLCVLIGLSACQSNPDSAEVAEPTGREPAGDTSALLLSAEVALQRGQYLEASRAYLRAAQASEDEELAEQAARVAFEHQQWSVVLAAAERWLALNHTNEEARRYAAFAALHLYQIDAAAEHLSTLLETAFINPQAGFLALLPQLTEEATPPAATAVLRKVLEKHAGLTEAHYALAQAAVQSDHLGLALEHARKARELGPYWAPAGLLLARVQMLSGGAEESLATARDVLKQDNQEPYRLEYALLLLQAGQEAEGRKELAALANHESTAAVVERALADIDFQLGQRESAAQRFSALAAGGRFVYDSLFYLGAIAEAREAWDEALQFYGRVTGGDMALAAQTRAARIKVQQQGLEAGLKHLEDFAATRPQHRVGAFAARATLLEESGDAAGALALLDRALKQYPDAAELRYARAFQLEGSNRIDEALSDLRALYQDRPGDPAAANALGYTLVDRTRRQADGLKFIEEALALTPDSGPVLDSMGWAMHRMGRHEEALQYLERARRRISDAEVDVHLAEVLLALNRRDEARELLSKAAERYPDNTDIKQRLQRLK